MSDDEDSQGYGGSMYAHSQADSIDDLMEDTISVCLLVPEKQSNQSVQTCFGCSKEPSHLDGSFERQQHSFWLRNKRIIFIYQPVYMSDDEDSQGYGGSMYAHSQADSIDDLMEDTISVCNQ